MALGGGASSGAIRAGRAFVEIFSRDADLRKGLAGLKGMLRKFGAGIAGVGASLFAPAAGILAGVAATFNEMVEHFSHIDDGAKRLRVTSDEFQTLEYIAGQTSVSMETLEKATVKLGIAIASNSPVLKDLIGDLSDFKKLDAPSQFALIAEKLNELEKSKGKAVALATAVKIFGKSAKELGPLFAEGKEGLDYLIARSHRIGNIFSEEDIKRGEKFGDLLNDLHLIIRNTFFTFTASLLETTDDFAELIDVIADVAKATQEWVRANRHAVLVAIGVTAAIAAIGLALLIVGAGFVVLASVITAAVTVWGALAATVTFFLSPLGLAILGIVALVAAITVAIIYFDDIEKAVDSAADGIARFFKSLGVAIRNMKYMEFFSRLGDFVANAFKTMVNPGLLTIKGIKVGLEITGDGLKEFYTNSLVPFFAGVKRDGSTAVQGILDSIIYGDFDGAMEIATLGLLAVWTHAVVAMEKQWASFKAFFVDGFLEGIYQIEVAMTKMSLSIQASIASALKPLALLNGNKSLAAFLDSISDPKRMQDELKKLEELHKKDLQSRKEARQQDIASAENDVNVVREKLEQAARVAEILRGSMFNEPEKKPGEDLLKSLEGKALGLFSAPDSKRAFAVAVDKDAKRTADASEETADNTKAILGEFSKIGGLVYT